ncbi:MAG: hypothetical protein HXS48_27635 [Theionarchaea archaeon]|nr:MAG: hypothetical protein AYK19_01930 [Theionarchaea archaeon DG-70-1]MBU7030735.1 hypothetical protein [Theionarchaea archaeon]
MYDVLFFLIGLGLIGLGVWYLYKDKFRVSLILIGFGLMGAGWLWPPGFCFGIVILGAIVLWIRLEAFGHLERER